jgi:hypothetical protein
MTNEATINELIRALEFYADVKHWDEDDFNVRTVFNGHYVRDDFKVGDEAWTVAQSAIDNAKRRER